MPSVYDLKPAFQKLLAPVLLWLKEQGVTPNQITTMALCLSAAGGGVVLTAAQGLDTLPWMGWIPVILFLRMALNALDGMMARNYQMTSPLGEVLNEVGDVVSDTLIYLPLVALVPGDGWSMLVVTLFVLLGILSEFCGILAKAMGGGRRYDGPMGKSDRALLVGVYALAIFFTPKALGLTFGLFSLACLLLLVSCWNRLKGVLIEPEKVPAEEKEAKLEAEESSPVDSKLDSTLPPAVTETTETEAAEPISSEPAAEPGAVASDTPETEKE
jgi:CDP-diacylglycerol--glycerol-3-phosphate 3-phosphatidyltransferase